MAFSTAQNFMVSLFLTLLSLQIVLSQDTCQNLKIIPFGESDGTAKIWNYANQPWQSNCDPTNNPIQSPVNLAVQDLTIGSQSVSLETMPSALADRTFTSVTFDDYNYTVRASTKNAILHVTVNNIVTTYTSQYMELRFPGEHQLNGYTFDGELQITFALDNQFCGQVPSTTAILAVPLKFDSKAPDNKIMKGFSSKFNGFNPSLTQVDLRSDLFSSFSSSSVSYIQYVGSLNVPDCTPGVQWFFLTKPLYVNSSLQQDAQVYFKNSQANFTTTVFPKDKTGVYNNTRTVQSIPGLIPVKGTFTFYADEMAKSRDYNLGDMSAWAKVWGASFGPIIFILIVIFIVGLWKLSSYHKHEKLIEREKQRQNQVDPQLSPEQQNLIKPVETATNKAE